MSSHVFPVKHGQFPWLLEKAAGMPPAVRRPHAMEVNASLAEPWPGNSWFSWKTKNSCKQYVRNLVGGFNHLEKYERYESQWEGLSHILWKIKHD